MKYQIIQNYGWANSGKSKIPNEDNKVIRKFNSWFSACLWKFFHYDLIAEPAWKASFIWKIKEIKNETLQDLPIREEQGSQ